MATDTLTTIQYSLLREEEKIKDLTQKFFAEPIAGLMKDGNKITTLKVAGRGLVRYFNDTVYPSGGFGQVAAGGDYAPAQTELEIQPNIALQMYAMSISYQEHVIATLEHGDRKTVMEGLRGKLKNAVDHTQRRLTRNLLMRGDGVVARASGAVSASTTVTSSIPLGLVIGDTVYARADSSGDGRGLAGSLEINGIRVTGVNYIANTFTLASAQTCTDNAVFYIWNGAHNAGGAGVYLHGVQAIFDDASNIVWDADDDTTYDHVDTYLGLARSSNPIMTPQTYNAASTSPTLSMFAACMNIALSYGLNPKDAYLIIHPTTWQAYLDTMVGFTVPSEMIGLPGGSYEVPYVTGLGQNRLKVIIDYSMPTDKFIIMDASKYYKLTAPGGWNKRTGSIWNRGATVASGSMGSVFTAGFDIWMQVAMNTPQTSVVAYNVTTT